MGKWHVLTAGPSAGKSSVIRELSGRGYRTNPEGARIFIDQKISEGFDPEEVRSKFNFHWWVEETDKRIERTLSDDETAFLDRSVADNIAYRNVHSVQSRPELGDFCRDRYGTIFMLERIDFQDDYARDENEEWAQRVHEELWRVYRDLGYEPIHVPLMPVDERADFIEGHI